MANAALLLNNFHLGGMADSKYSGIANSFATGAGLNLHAEPGVLKINQKLTKESGSTVDDAVSMMVVCSDGNTYLFGRTNGKIWKRTSSGTYTLQATCANGGILNAREYQGYIFYATNTKIGRWTIGTSWATRTDNYATFTNGNSAYHPMIVKNVVLYIGDGFNVGQIDENLTYIGDALDLEKRFIVKSLGEVGNDIIVGAFVASNVVETKVFRWNTYSFSFTSDDFVPEVGINCFLPTDNAAIVQAGQKGNLYAYNGEQLQQFKRIPGDWTSTNEAHVNSEASINYNGLPLFGLSNGSGNPTNQGVYSFGSFSSNYPQVLNLEYIISTNNLNNVEICSMAMVGNDILVAWKDLNGGTTYGVDKVDWSNKYSSAFLEFRVLNVDRMNAKDIFFKAAYRSLPANTAITLQKSINNAAYTNVTLINDTNHFYYYTKERISGAYACQLKVGFTVSGNLAPEIEAFEISF